MDEYADKRYNDCPLREDWGGCVLGREEDLKDDICRSRCIRCCCSSIGCFLNATCPRATGNKITNFQKLIYMGWKKKKNG